jgi:type VI secretion system secreted protein Hcp
VATNDMLLKLDGVVGESHDVTLKDHIELVSWSWGMLSPTDMSTGHVAAKAKVDDFKIIKRVDRSSPVLIKYLKENTIVKKGRLIVRKAGGSESLPYYEVEFTNVRVTSFRTNTENTEVTETVTLAFETANFKYTPQAQTGAKGGGSVEYTVSAYGPER